MKTHNFLNKELTCRNNKNLEKINVILLLLYFLLCEQICLQKALSMLKTMIALFKKPKLFSVFMLIDSKQLRLTERGILSSQCPVNLTHLPSDNCCPCLGQTWETLTMLESWLSLYPDLVIYRRQQLSGTGTEQNLFSHSLCYHYVYFSIMWDVLWEPCF